ncbi:ribonuclease HII [Alphaproteobacteria bacterium]|nr:ribonuclease HII [Alphaproteobacteria bacterium]
MPDFSVENRLIAARHIPARVAGVDEVGRGPLAGPVVCACVMFDGLDIDPNLAAQINDSKALSPKKRVAAAAAIRASGAVIALGAASAMLIDRLNILQATLRAMEEAVGRMAVRPLAVIVDGNRVPDGLAGIGEPLVGGDAKSLSVAAASIIAKVARDELMARLALRWPAYGWEKNAGYGSPVHLAALQAQGITPHHRRSFGPVAAVIRGGEPRGCAD